MEDYMKKMYRVILAALVLGAGVLSCDLIGGDVDDVVGKLIDTGDAGLYTVTFTLDGNESLVSVAKGTVINDTYADERKSALGVPLEFGVTGLTLGIDGAAVTVSRDIEIPLVWKFNGVAVETWHTVTFTINNTPYRVRVPNGASLTVAQRTALEAFLEAPSGSLGEVTWIALSNITENKTETITVTIYTVTFEDGDGTVLDTKGAVLGRTVALPDDPFKDGYIFEGWKTQANGGGAAFTASTPVPGNIVVYAQWTARPYTITVISYGNGTVNSTPADTATVGTTITLTVAPADGWQLQNLPVIYTGGTITPSGSGPYAFTMTASDVTVQAVFVQVTGNIHSVTIGTFANGAVSGPDSATAGDPVTLTVNAAAGYKLESIT
jgi:uncharacterized repeat protein (TIGR02543 family)